MSSVCTAAIIVYRHIIQAIAKVETQLHGRDGAAAAALIQDYEELTLYEVNLALVAEIGIGIVGNDENVRTIVQMVFAHKAAARIGIRNVCKPHSYQAIRDSNAI